MNTQNVKTAATKTTETWVKQNFDVHLSMRTNRRVSLAKLEGDLMKHRAMQKLGVDTEELFDDLQLAVACIAKLLRMRPANEWMKLPPDEFDRLVWKSLRQLDLGLDYEPASPIPDQVH